MVFFKDKKIYLADDEVNKLYKPLYSLIISVTIIWTLCKAQTILISDLPNKLGRANRRPQTIMHLRSSALPITTSATVNSNCFT